MSPTRRAYLDRSPGEVRGVITLDGRPERLLIAREDDPTPRLGARYVARVEAVSARMGLARLDLGEASGALRLRGGAALHEGQRLKVEVVAEPVRGKPAALRRLDDAAADAPSRRIAAAKTVAEQLAALGFADPMTGEAAREAADEAQAQALAVVHRSAGGLDLAVEPTRALTAVDVDLAEDGLSVSRANLQALNEAARLLRVKAIGGLIAVDLIGFPKAARALVSAAQAAFAPDGPEVAIAAPSRFGVMEIAKPHGRQPLHEQLLDPDGRRSARTLAQETVRALERQGRFQPGALLIASRSPEVAALAAPLAARLGPRFQVLADLGVERENADIDLR